MRRLLLVSGCVLVLSLAACSDPAAENAAKKKAAEKPAPVGGLSALWKMYQVARSWALDAQVLKANGIPLSEVEPVRGKAAAWEGTFTSATKGKSRSFTYSVIESQGNLHKGVFAGPEVSWSGGSGQDSPFLAIAVKTDTDAAYKTALAKAADYEKKNPNQPISLLLEKTKKHTDPCWRIIWGESASTSSFSIYVDATTGEYLETLH
jgi:hypothetical protein